MVRLIKDILPLSATEGTFTKLDFGMDESDWKAAQGKSSGYVIGWWEGKVGATDFPASTSTEVFLMTEGRIALTDVEGNRKEMQAGEAYLLPPGFAGHWETLEDAKKLYILLEHE